MQAVLHLYETFKLSTGKDSVAFPRCFYCFRRIEDSANANANAFQTGCCTAERQAQRAVSLLQGTR